MDESEFALQGVDDSASPRVARIVETILRDTRIYGMWESRHADLLRPVAKHSDKRHQIVTLRNAEVKLVHRRALFRFLRLKQVRGEPRRRLFRMFHSTLDFDAAVLAEHRQYMLAVSSRISADHLIDVMHDPKSKLLLSDYERLYGRYFGMKCLMACRRDGHSIELIRNALGDTRDDLSAVRRRIDREPPVKSCGSFDRQEALARSGRYPVLNYMVG